MCVKWEVRVCLEKEEGGIISYLIFVFIVRDVFKWEELF